MCKQAIKFNNSVTLTGYQKIFKIQKIYQKRKAQESSSIYCLLYIKQRLLCTKFIYYFFIPKDFHLLVLLILHHFVQLVELRSMQKLGHNTCKIREFP